MSICHILDMLPWSGNNTGVTDEFMDKMVEVLKDFVHQTYDRETKVIDFKSQSDILKELDFEIKDHSSELHELISMTKRILELSVKTGRIHFMLK